MTQRLEKIRELFEKQEFVITRSYNPWKPQKATQEWCIAKLDTKSLSLKPISWGETLDLAMDIAYTMITEEELTDE